jgi:tRNA dimethylallyltransferase
VSPPRESPAGPPLCVLVGPTAAGKSALALALAERRGGEILSADSAQVHRGLDIGTAKPTADERRRVPHHLLDLVGPDERLDAAAWADRADQAIAEIRARGAPADRLRRHGPLGARAALWPQPHAARARRRRRRGGP